MIVFIVSPYKDPAKIHFMKKFFDRFVTGFFVLTFGIIWFFSTHYYVKTKPYQIIAYDVYGKKITPEEIRTKFQTSDVAISYIKEYQMSFPHLSFSIESDIPEIRKRSLMKKILQRVQR